MLLTPQELYDKVKIDNIYFQATEGGICFGGGEPLLHSDFIKEFRDICGSKWKITVETALACSWADINLLASIVDHWIVDIKDMKFIGLIEPFERKWYHSKCHGQGSTYPRIQHGQGRGKKHRANQGTWFQGHHGMPIYQV